VRDEDVRTSCSAALEVLAAEFGEDIPYQNGLDRGFAFRGQRAPFLNRQKGIHRAAVQRGPAALSILTSWKSPYGDEVTPDGVVYAYRDGPIDQADNRALRAAFELQVPLVYFLGTRAWWYRAFYPAFVVADDPGARAILVSFGRMVGPLDEREPVLVSDPIERRYVVREVKTRMHQARFRGRVLPAYRDQCAMCRLREVRLLDAAHIVADAEATGEPAVTNGLALCSIHHRAFDQDLVGVSPDYDVRVSRRLLDYEDGPMLDLLKGFHGAALTLPARTQWRPDQERLAERFERFLAHGLG
jgi:putative restriction endonuclease